MDSHHCGSLSRRILRQAALEDCAQCLALRLGSSVLEANKGTTQPLSFAMMCHCTPPWHRREHHKLKTLQLWKRSHLNLHCVNMKQCVRFSGLERSTGHWKNLLSCKQKVARDLKEQILTCSHDARSTLVTSGRQFQSRQTNYCILVITLSSIK